MSIEISQSQPLYGASFGQAVSRYFSKYATFSGRASRSEFWWAVLLINGVMTILLGLLVVTLAGMPTIVDGNLNLVFTSLSWVWFSLAVVWWLFNLIPTLALYSRRLHDANLSAWWLLLCLVPFVSSTIFILVIGLLPQNPLGARYDVSP